ncbi:lipopolysaccharide biosynthesis protein RfbH [Azospirillum tabaci]|uniref:lipopolysaccharide biosynthesis protein RfbH n=1 Tax=Azospirillum tabaci TaxID=2752310 RepID=UPI0016603523|nr:lipopolysaccharide biosynthesis protein RfbH [Azospirillum tabaci]
MTEHHHDEAEALRQEILRLTQRYAEITSARPPFDPASSPVPVSGRVYGAQEVHNLVDASLEFWLTTGRFNDAFERRLAETVGARHALTCNSGSSANLLAISALCSPLLGDQALQRGDEVITCATGFPTTVNPIIQNGLVPVFVDVDIPTYNADPIAVAEAVTPRTRAIVLAHTLGNPFDLGAVMDVARRHNLHVVEDCCDALGAHYNGRPVGSFGTVATLSFYPAHHITTGEGGAVATNVNRIKRALESIRDWGRDCWCAPGRDNTCGRRFERKHGGLPEGYDHKYVYSHAGYNLKMTDLQAAVGLAQMDRLSDFITIRRRNYETLHNALRAFDDLLVLPQATPGSDPSWFGFPITLREEAGVKREALLRWLNGRRIGTRLLFGGNLTKQPYLMGRAWRTHGDLARSDTVMNRTFWVGVYPALDDAALGYVVDSIAAYFGRSV